MPQPEPDATTQRKLALLALALHSAELAAVERTAEQIKQRAEGIADRHDQARVNGKDGDPNAVLELAALVTQVTELVRLVARMAAEEQERNRPVRESLERALGSLKRLPAWARRQAPEAQRWLAQLPQEVLDSPYLERSFEAMAAGGLMANDRTLELLRARVQRQDVEAEAEVTAEARAADLAYCDACQLSHKPPVAAVGGACPGGEGSLR